MKEVNYHNFLIRKIILADMDISKGKIAIILIGDLSSRKGKTNAELNRTKFLLDIAPYQVDVFSFQIYDGFWARKLRHTQKKSTPQKYEIDGIPIRCFWKSFSLIDYFLTVKLNKAPIVNKRWMERYIEVFKDYGLIITNSCDGGEMALAINRKFNIPYCVTWHGTDIHTAPFKSNYMLELTKIILENALMNFMVSEALLETSKRITDKAPTLVLYNGVNSSFTKYDENKKMILRKKYKVEDKKIVSYAGYIEDVKNPLLLPRIFENILKHYSGKIEFWVIGDGKLRIPLEAECRKLNIPVKFWGNQPVNVMPDLYNCTNVLLLPSKNEGLPLVVVEALACGANVVGSDVGGIKEAIGKDNVFQLGQDFVSNISSRIVEMLEDEVKQPLSPIFSWERTAEVENSFYSNFFKNM